MYGGPDDLRTSPSKILNGLSLDDMRLLQPYLVRQELCYRDELLSANQPISHMYFVEAGLVSLISTDSRRREVEVAIAGRDEVVGIELVLGDNRSINKAVVQVAGTSLRISASDLLEVIASSRSLHLRLLNYVRVLMTQMSQTALANGKGSVEERLARWLLMAHDRLEGDDYPQTHEFLSIMLGVRRAGVTVALHNLEGKGFIRSNRGIITILNRADLELYADGLYGVPEKEHKRLLG